MKINNQIYYVGAISSLLALIVLCLAWEWLLAPLRPSGSWMMLKVLPLLPPLRSIIKRDVYTLQWTSMLILLYFTEGIVRGSSDQNHVSVMLAWGEAALACVYFFCAILYVKPYKQAAKAAKAAKIAQTKP
jgi:uncharacterized membrane protein